MLKLINNKIYFAGDRRISFFLQDNEKCIENDGESENSSNTTLTIQEEEDKKGSETLMKSTSFNILY